MATLLQQAAHTTQQISVGTIDTARQLPRSLPRQVTKGLNYLLGRGFIALVLGGAALATGGQAIWAIGLGIPLLTGWQAFVDYRKEQDSKYHLVEEFSEEIGKLLGKAPSTITTQDLQTVAKGDPARSLPANPVLREEWDRIGRTRSMQFVTTALSGLITIAAILIPIIPAAMIPEAGAAAANIGVEAFNNLANASRAWVDQLKIFLDATILANSGTMQSVVANGFTYTGITMSAGIIIQGVNNALDFAGSHLLGIHAKTAHERIDDIARSIENGKLVTKEQVLGVYVCTNKDLAEDIEKAFGKPYSKLGWQKQQAAVAMFDEIYDIHNLTDNLNHKYVKPQELAFIAVGQSSGVKPTNQYEEALDAHEEEVSKAKEEAAEPEKEKPTIQSFVERFAPGQEKEAESTKSFLERVSKNELDAAATAHSRN